MGATAGNGSVIGSALWCVATAVPVAIGGFLIYDKQRSVAHAAPPAPPAEVRDGDADSPPASERVVVAPRYADPELLKQKKAQDALLRPRVEAAQRQADAREAAKSIRGEMKPTGNSRPSRVGPAPEPPPETALRAVSPAPVGGSSTGPRIYGLPEDPPPAPPQPARGVRRR